MSVYTCICVLMILRPSVPTKQKMERGGGRDGEERRKMMRWCYHMMRSWKSAADIKTSLQPSNSSKAVYCTHFRLQESCSNFGSFWTTLIFPWQPEVAEREQNPQDPHISSVAKWHKCMSWTLLLPGSWGSPKIHPKVLQWYDDLFFQERTAEQQSTIWVSLKIGYKPSK